MSKYVKRPNPQEQTALQLHKKKPVLGHLDIELTERCNLNCIHCYINQPANDRTIMAREMKTGQIKDVLDQAVELGCLSIRFTGGEPLLRPDFNELYLYARQLGLRVTLFTNATLITDKFVALFSRIPALEKIEITVYGMSQESYTAITGRQTAFKAVHQGINRLINHNIPVIIKSVFLHDNRHEADAFEKWAATLPWMDKPPMNTVVLSMRARRDLPDKQQQIAGQRSAAETVMQFLLRDEKKYRTVAGRFCQTFAGVPGKKLFRCGAGNGCTVDAYGTVQPCLLLRHPDTVWDLREHSLRRVITVFFPKLRDTTATHPEYLTRCARCRLKAFCEQCPGQSWMEHGTLDTPVEYLCRLAHVQARALGILQKDENGWDQPGSSNESADPPDGT